jgi:hypothetical protein
VVRITRDALNVDLLKSFGAAPLSKALGVSQEAVRKRLFQNSRFSDKTMARLRASIEVEENGRAHLVPLPFATEDERTARRVERQLQVMNAGPRGPLSLNDIEERISGHLTSKDARNALRHRLPLMWQGRPLIKDKLSDEIVEAIDAASGANGTHVIEHCRAQRIVVVEPRDRPHTPVNSRQNNCRLAKLKIDSCERFIEHKAIRMDGHVSGSVFASRRGEEINISRAMGNDSSADQQGRKKLENCEIRSTGAGYMATTVDVYCGCGGLTLGARQAGYGRVEVGGEIVSLSAQHIAIRRVDERIGEIVVHFPRAGFLVLAA